MLTPSVIDPSYRLIVKFGNTLVGTLFLDQKSGRLHLEYDNDWQQNGFPISPALAFHTEHPSEVAYNYLDNTLPEGEARNLLAQNLGISEKNIYSQIRALGIDLAGAMTFNKVDENENIVSQTTEPFYRKLEETELIYRLNQKENIGLLNWDDKPRLSVAGVQDKLNVMIHSDKSMGFGDGSLCSTHILKFEKPNCPNLVINEYFCMKLSKALGLPTADVNFMRLAQHPILIVKRFDRNFVPHANKVMRRHVIDGCQALNLPRDYKYERNLGDGRDVKHIHDGAGLHKLFQFCRTMQSPVESTQWLINWQLYNLIINNYDSHGKNVSIFFDKNNSQFTPAYDLVNVAMFPQFKHVLAMAMGDEFDPNNIHAYQLADFAETCNIDKKLLSRVLISLSEKVLEKLENNQMLGELTQDKAITEADVIYLTDLSKNIRSRATHLLSEAKGILSISV